VTHNKENITVFLESALLSIKQIHKLNTMPWVVQGGMGENFSIRENKWDLRPLYNPQRHAGGVKYNSTHSQP
jgi:hypothetical protein